MSFFTRAVALYDYYITPFDKNSKAFNTRFLKLLKIFHIFFSLKSLKMLRIFIFCCLMTF